MISGGLNKTARQGPGGCLCILMAVGWLMFLPGHAHAAVLQVDAEKQLNLADHFFSIQEYPDAVSEYRKFLFFFPDHNRAAYARFRVAMAYFKQKAYERAVALFEGIAGGSYAGEFSVDASFMVSRCYTAMGRGARAVANLKALMEVMSDAATVDRAWHEIGWIYLETARPLTDRALESARMAFSNISESGKNKYFPGILMPHLDRARFDPGGLMADMKSPGLAGGLAIVPGAGYLYSGRYQDALIAFLFNVGMMIAAYESFDNDNEALGVIIAGVELGFYAGNIYGSISAAHKYNRNLSDAFLKNLPRPSAATALSRGRSPAICFSMGFPF